MSIFQEESRQPDADTCRDRGMRSGDAGALRLSSSGYEDSFGQHKIPTGSCCHEDRRKAPTLPDIHPLSLQDARDASVSKQRRPYIRTLIGLVAVFCFIVVLVSASDSTPKTTNGTKKQSISTTNNGVITYSTSSQDVVIRTFYGGGKLGSFEYSPEISIYGDGSYILGPGLTMREGQMSSDALEQLLQTLVDTDGLLKFTTRQFYDVPDQNATFLQLMLNNTGYSYQYGPFGNLQESAQDMSTYHRLGAALSSIINAVNGSTHPYTSSQVALLVHQDFNPDLPQSIPSWSLPDFNLYNLAIYECGPPEVGPTGPNADTGCLTYTVPQKALLLNQKQQQAVLSLLKGQQQGVFSDQGQYYTVTLRPLLPDELAQKTLAMMGSAELDYTGVPLQEGPVPIATPAG